MKSLSLPSIKAQPQYKKMKRIIIIIKTTMKKIRTLIPKRKLRKTVYVWVGHLLYHKLYHYGIRTNWIPWRTFICKLFNSWNSVTETLTSFVSIIFPKAKFSNWVLFRIVGFIFFFILSGLYTFPAKISILAGIDSMQILHCYSSKELFVIGANFFTRISRD